MTHLILTNNHCNKTVLTYKREQNKYTASIYQIGRKEFVVYIYVYVDIKSDVLNIYSVYGYQYGINVIHHMVKYLFLSQYELKKED